MKNLKLNTSAIKKVILAGAILLPIPFVLKGCEGKKGKNTAEDTKTTIETTEELLTEETLTEATLTEATVDENQVCYDQIKEMESNIVGFTEDYLPYGFGEVEINDTNRESIAEMYTNAYIMLNVKDLGKSLAVLDQNLEIIPSEAAKDFMKFARLTAHYSQIQTPDTMLDFSKIVANEKDAEFLNNLSEEIAYMNVATTDKERQERINNIVEIKKNLIEYYELGTYDYSTMYMALNLIIEADATAKAYGNEIFTSEEDKNQVYNTMLKYNCGEDEVEELAVTAIAMEDVQAKNSLESKVSVYYKSLLEDMLNKVENMGLGDFDAYYSYASVTTRISKQIDGLYLAPGQTNIEKENAIRANGPANGKGGKGSVSTKEVDPSQVPEGSRVPNKTKYDDTDNGKDINKVVINQDDYVVPGSQVDVVDSETASIRGEAAGRYDGSSAAYSAQISSGSIPSTISSAPTPSVPSAYSKYASSYISGYQKGYVAAYNNYVSTAKSSQSTPTTTYEPVNNGEETITYENTTDIYYNTTPSNEYNQSGTYFIPVDDGEEIIINEETNTIGSLKELRKELIASYVTAYVDDYYENLENGYAKRM